MHLDIRSDDLDDGDLNQTAMARRRQAGVAVDDYAAGANRDGILND
jgi:hypothetical protein